MIRIMLHQNDLPTSIDQLLDQIAELEQSIDKKDDAGVTVYPSERKLLQTMYEALTRLRKAAEVSPQIEDLAESIKQRGGLL